MSMQRILLNQFKRINFDNALWAYPILAGFGWFIWDGLDQEWLISLNLATDPDAVVIRVEKERLARIQALQQTKLASKPPKPSIAAAVDVAEEEEEEEEEEEVEVEKEIPVEEDETTEETVDKVEEEEGEEEAEEEEEEKEVVVKPLYLPTKAKKLGTKEVWDNFTIKALNMNEDDDDDDEEEEEEEEEE